MAESQTVVPGERRITWRPTLEPEKRWEGTIANDAYAERVWQEPTIERVVREMDKDLGVLDERQYVVAE